MVKSRKIGNWTIQFRTKNDTRKADRNLVFGRSYGVKLTVYPWKLVEVKINLGLRTVFLEAWHNSFRWEGE
jgi:hypothetical protein